MPLFLSFPLHSPSQAHSDLDFSPSRNTTARIAVLGCLHHCRIPLEKIGMQKDFCCFLFRGLSGSGSREPWLFGEKNFSFSGDAAGGELFWEGILGHICVEQLWCKPTQSNPLSSCPLLGEVHSVCGVLR